MLIIVLLLELVSKIFSAAVHTARSATRLQFAKKFSVHPRGYLCGFSPRFPRLAAHPTNLATKLLLRSVLGCCSLLPFLCAGCEYEFKDEPAPAASTIEVVVSEELRSPDEGTRERSQVPPTPADVRPVLAPGKDVSGQAAVPQKSKKSNLSQLIENGELVVTANIPGLRDLDLAFDEVEDTLSKSEGINPYQLIFQFKNPRMIRAVRVLSTYSDYGWAFVPEGGERLVVDTVIDGQWSTIAWPDGLKTAKFSVEVLRKMRDNFVHLNEVEVYE